jgi:hypothetical protein
MRSPWLKDKFVAPRRRVLMGAALLGAGSILGGASGCSLIPGSTPTNIDPKVIDEINQAIASTCNTAVVVAASTIVAVVLAQFPPLAALTTLAPNAAAEVAAFICALIPPISGGTTPTTPPPVTTTTPPPAQATMAVVKGVSIPIHGFHLVNGKFVWF